MFGVYNSLKVNQLLNVTLELEIIQYGYHQKKLCLPLLL